MHTSRFNQSRLMFVTIMAVSIACVPVSAEEKELVEKIHDAQKLRASQEKELEDIRLERLNIVNKNKDTQKIPSPEKWGLVLSPDRSISSEHFNQN